MTVTKHNFSLKMKVFFSMIDGGTQKHKREKEEELIDIELRMNKPINSGRENPYSFSKINPFDEISLSLYMFLWKHQYFMQL